MVKQIKRFEPHQTAKVFAVLLAIASIPMLLPAVLMSIFAPHPVDAAGNEIGPPVFIFFVFPVFYLIFGYIFVRLGCWLYNIMYQYIGGIEIELEDKQ